MARMPIVFFGHGNPLNALADNAYTQAWRALGEAIPRPRAILMISAHWYLEGTRVTAGDHPRTIHDFGGFPKALFEVQYPAPGDAALGNRVTGLLAPLSVQSDATWGLDHGTWSVLIHAYPDATVPIVQLSIDETQPPAFHYALGEKLRPLRDEGVLIAASGNIVHNLEAYAWGRHEQAPYGWALRFEQNARELMLARDFAPLIDYPSMGEDAMLSAPTPDHYLPLLYILGASDARDTVSFPVEGMDGGSISMLSVRFTG
ncbi:MAG TPA: 4,5-DOPA dioxygenase extradiol [Candidatus Baltobacteraceae bacterium]|nr:4,5-DOPA dioxygenase extradiol [Candidatus Baltobacteraceae bacterium]